MGLLVDENPLGWEETRRHADEVRERGVRHFIRVFLASRNRYKDPFLWGDEVEFMIIRLNEANSSAAVSLRASGLLEVMKQREQDEGDERQALWRPEAGSWMMEGTPGQPFGSNPLDNLFGCCDVEKNMRFRRKEIADLLLPHERVVSLTAFPRLGCSRYFHPNFPVNPLTSRLGSFFLPDECVSSHPRYLNGFENLKKRRGRKVLITAPVSKDSQTADPFVDELFVEKQMKWDENREHHIRIQPNMMHMDASVFGTGCCCLQVTMQASDLDEALMLYDQLAPLTPIALALTAASPVHRGLLMQRDTRWSIISQSLDDRTQEEESDPLTSVPKSRYSSISCYLSESSVPYNDVTLNVNRPLLQRLLESEVPEGLAKHVAHLFIRDPLLLMPQSPGTSSQQVDEQHFENIQSTNWNNLRLKPPPLDASMGWRIELRPMELQVTDFENAAFAVFTVLMSRTILKYKLDLRIPISLLDDNMIRAEERDACMSQKFWFRKLAAHSLADSKSNHDDYCLLSVDEIVNGCTDFQGLIVLIREYLNTLDLSKKQKDQVCKYLDFVSGRASGKYRTAASWIRVFAHSSPHYRQDSVFNDKMQYDLLKIVSEIRDDDAFLNYLQ